MVGDLSEPNLFAPDYMFEPPEISGGVEAAIGVVGCLVTAGILIALVRALAIEAITRRQIASVVPVVALGVYVGFSWRVMTAAVSGGEHRRRAVDDGRNRGRPTARSRCVSALVWSLGQCARSGDRLK